MKTQVIDLSREFDRGVALGGRLLSAGKLVAFPTETVYGLGANGLDPEAVKSIFAAKGRPMDNPLILHVSQKEEADSLCIVSGEARRLMEAFWPGPLTMVLPKRPHIPGAVTAGLSTVAVRMPSHEGARALIAAAGCPIAAPSANLSGKPSPTRAEHVLEDMDGKIPLILDGGSCDWGLESTVLSLSGPEPVILRPGAVTPEMIAEVLGSASVAQSVLTPLKEGETVLSPGMKYKHYAPRAEVILADGEGDALAETAAALYDRLAAQGKKTLILGSRQTCRFYGRRNCVIMGDRTDPKSICSVLFSFLRQADADGYDAVVLEALPPQALGLAFMNRALRAAGFRVEHGAGREVKGSATGGMIEK